MLLWGLIWWLAYRCKKKVLLVVFPILALAIELYVGLSPFGSGLLFALFAAFLLCTLGSASIVRKGIALALVGASVCLTGVWFKEDIQRLATYHSKQALLQWQENLSLDSFNIFKLLKIDMQTNMEMLTNNTPQYTGKIVLEMECNLRPTDTVYLKGFHGTNYENGNWTYDEKAFTEACKEVGKTDSEVAKQMFQALYEKKRKGNSLIYEQYGSNQTITYKILYTGTTSDVAYVPYCSDYDSFDEDYTFMGDYLLKKSIFDNSIEVTAAHNKMSDVFDWMTIGDVEETAFLNKFADTYLQLPQNKKYLEKIGQDIFIGWTTEENLERISYAYLIKNHLAQRMSYSLRLDVLPEGVDPVEYALTKGQEGYCMHFATAAALLLREAGVPARYASGYAVDVRSFLLDKETNTFKAKVGDYMAHAWVEVYLDNIGWVPIEVTPVGSLTSLPTDKDILYWDKISNDKRQERPDLEIDTETEDDSEITEDTEVDTQDSQMQDTQEDTSSETETQEDTQIQTDSDDKKEPSFLGSMSEKIGIVGVIAGFVLLMLMVYRTAILRYEKLLNTEIEENMTRKAVARINRRLYRILCLSNVDRWFGKKWNDLEYQKALEKQFTVLSTQEWQKYMDIVKKNHYSKETITTEEMKYCYDCYIACVRKKKK